MCWVMPPASPAATSVSRIASSRLVLPWSTCPMTVMTGARGSRSAGSSTATSSASASSSAACDDLDLAREVVGEDRDGLVGERLRDGDHLAVPHERLDDLGGRDAEELRESLTLAPEGTLTTLVGIGRRHRLSRRVAAAAAAAPAAPVVPPPAGPRRRDAWRR